jgi:hypothetical protein
MAVYVIPSLAAFGLILAFVLDIVFQRRNAVRKNDANWQYTPNLHVWGMGLLAGISYTLVYLYARIILSFIEQFPENKAYTWQHLIPLLLSSLMIGLLLWAIVKLSRND